VIRLIALILLVAAPAWADEDSLVYSNVATETCLAEDKGAECIGLSAGQCMENTPGGHSTYGMGGCLSLEADYWDERLNAAYQVFMSSAREADEYNKEMQISVLSQADALRDMQRAWISYRDARCGYEYSLWGGGTGGGPASVSCFMQMTAEQALYLQASGVLY